MEPDASKTVPITPSDLSFEWLANPGTYEVLLPGYSSARLSFSLPGGNPIAFNLQAPTGLILDRGMAVATQGRFSGSARWFKREGAPYPQGQFAFGVPTPLGAASLAASRTYAIASDSGFLYALSAPDGQFVFDRDNGTITGFIDVAYSDAWGPYSATRYSLTPGSFIPGGTSFTASFPVPGAPFLGTIEGYFTGQQAEELILRWRAPVQDPYNQTWTAQTGVRVGKID